MTKTILGVTAMVFGIVWLAVFICALSDRLRGVERIDPDEEDRADTTSDETTAGVSGWKRVLLAPFFALLAGFMFIILFPMGVVELLFRPRNRSDKEGPQ